jgi:hypothetical protein
VSEKPIVLLIAVTVHNGGLDLAADFTNRPDRRTPVYFRTDFYNRMTADESRSFDDCVGHDRDVVGDHDGTMLGVEHDTRFEDGVIANGNAVGIDQVNTLVDFSEPEGFKKIRFQGLGVFSHQFPRVF